MDIFKAQLARIQAQLQGLSASQKMLTGTLVAIMVATLFYWVHYAGDPEMTPILNQTLSQDDIGNITACLQAKDIAFKVTGNQILVPTDRRFEALADLSYTQALPHNFSTGFDEIAKSMSPWDAPDLTEARFNHAKEMTLSQVLSQFPGVANATVMIDPTSDRSFDNQTSPSATITIFTRDNDHDHIKQLANSAADMVCGYVSKLQRSRVSVIIDGLSLPVQDRNDDSYVDGTQLDTIRQAEQMYEQKVQDNLGSHIPGLSIAVTAEVDTKRTDVRSTTVDPKALIHVESDTHEHTEDSTTPGAGGEPGVTDNTANVSASVGAPAGGGGSSGSTSISDEQTQFVTIPSTTEQETHQGPGVVTVVHASVQVPRSYFIQTWKADNNSQKDPDDATLQKYMDDQKTQIRQSVMADCDLTKEDAVVVATYSDVTAPGPADMASPQIASTAMTNIFTAHGKEMGVGTLALISLFMMMMMVRKATPVPVEIPIPPEPVKLDNTLIAGEAVEGSAMLDAVELDGDTVKTQQMLDQVQNMVSGDPDAAANLVKRWLNRS
jgi:flagellar M-ring protein FliF